MADCDHHIHPCVTSWSHDYCDDINHFAGADHFDDSNHFDGADHFDDSNHFDGADHYDDLNHVDDANDVDENGDFSSCPFYEDETMTETERLQRLEEEQEQLNSSLIALTSHFAQVQFRLKQIVDATSEEKELLLKDLEEFAFRGIPNVQQYESGLDLTEIITEQQHEEKLEMQRAKQKELINKLKEQLEDLEHYAYETGEAGMPQSMILERQSVIIEQLKGKLLPNLDEMNKLNPEELRAQVDLAIKELVNPVKMKEQLVGQLKTQVTDLERFINFLQGEAASKGPPSCTCDCPVHGKKGSNSQNPVSKKQSSRDKRTEKANGNVMQIIRRVLTLLHVFTIAQFSCSSNNFHKNSLKKTAKGNHYGDLRANLEVSVNEVEKLLSEQEPPFEDSDYTSDSEESPVIQCNEKLTTAVRKNLAGALRDLIQHGLMPVGQSTSLVPFGCFAVHADSPSKMIHAWDLILKYYELKNGYQYNASPARKLCQSFNLEIVGGVAITPKQSLLSTIGNIISTHTPLKRSPDSHFKALVCAALNEKRLVSWLRLIFKTKILVERFYQPWSYTVSTGFEDGLRSLDRLTQRDFDLPVDLAIRQLQNIKDAF